MFLERAIIVRLMLVDMFIQTGAQLQALLHELLDKEKRDLQHVVSLHLVHSEPLLQRKLLKNGPEGLDIRLLALPPLAEPLYEQVDVVV